jgi:hypothetical protein
MHDTKIIGGHDRQIAGDRVLFVRFIPRHEENAVNVGSGAEFLETIAKFNGRPECL